MVIGFSGADSVRVQEEIELLCTSRSVSLQIASKSRLKERDPVLMVGGVPSAWRGERGEVQLAH